jgi:hypothetical protein
MRFCHTSNRQRRSHVQRQNTPSQYIDLCRHKQDNIHTKNVHIKFSTPFWNIVFIHHNLLYSMLPVSLDCPFGLPLRFRYSQTFIYIYRFVQDSVFFQMNLKLFVLIISFAVII